MLRGLLDPWLFRRPFEDRSARRYARKERPAFGDLDTRLCDRWEADLGSARVVLDLGAGPGTFVAAARARWPHLAVIAAEPSRTFSATLGAGAVRCCAEVLPLRDGCVDVAVLVSSIRHVRDRAATLAELRRAIRPGGAALVVELDPEADRRRVRAHADHLATRLLRAAFGPLVVRTAPSADSITALARTAGWSRVDRCDDPEQPVYILRLS